MVVVAKATFPRRHLNQAVAAYTGLPPLPDGIVKNGPYFQPGADIVRALTIYTFPEDASADPLSCLQERYGPFATIPDFHCEIQEWREFREFLSGWVK